jgi:hypothetical protein
VMGSTPTRLITRVSSAGFNMRPSCPCSASMAI